MQLHQTAFFDSGPLAGHLRTTMQLGTPRSALVVEAAVVVGMVEDAFLRRPERRGAAAVEVQRLGKT